MTLPACLVAAVLVRKAGLPDEAKSDAGNGRSDRRAGNRRCDLRRRHGGKSGDKKYDQRGHDDRAGADHDERPLGVRVIDQCAERRCHDHAGKSADRHDQADLGRRPMLALQIDSEKGAEAAGHVRHEEVDGVERP